MGDLWEVGVAAQTDRVADSTGELDELRFGHTSRSEHNESLVEQANKDPLQCSVVKAYYIGVGDLDAEVSVQGFQAEAQRSRPDCRDGLKSISVASAKHIDTSTP